MTLARIANVLRSLADRLDPPETNPGEWVEIGRGPAPVRLYVSPLDKLDRTRHDR